MWNDSSGPLRLDSDGFLWLILDGGEDFHEKPLGMLDVAEVPEGCEGALETLRDRWASGLWDAEGEARGTYYGGLVR